MIVKNEAGLLARCLASVKPVADQIVVVDTGSTDDTADIARSFGAEVVFDEWHNDFSWSRNVSLEHATGAWILWLDADDVVPPESLPKIAALKKNDPDRVYGFIVRNQRPDNTGTEFVQARMFPNRYDIYFERIIHEQMMPSALRLGFVLDSCDIVVEHHGYADPATLRKKAGRNIELLLKEFNPKIADPVSAVEIADAYQIVDEPDTAAKWYTAVLAIPGCVAESPAIASQAHRGLGDILNKKEQYQEAIVHYEAAFQLAPWRTDVLYMLAVAHECSGAAGRAIACLRRVRNVTPRPGQVGVNFREVRIKASLRLLRLLTEQNMGEAAAAEAADAVEADPDRPEIALMAGKVCLASGKIVEALRHFEKSITLTTHLNLDSYIGLCLIYRQAGRMKKAAETLEAIRPLYGELPRYLAFRRKMLDEQEMPPEMSSADLEKELEQIRIDFFGMM